MNSNTSVSATLKHLQAQPEILDDVQAGLLASEENDFEEAIRRSLNGDFDVIVDNPHSSRGESPSLSIERDSPSPTISEIGLPIRRSARVPLSFSTGCSDTRYERKPTVRNCVKNRSLEANPSTGSEPNMKTKKKPEAERWTWISSINDPNDIGDRHLLQTYCFDFPRCKQKPRCLRCTSPFCLHNMGEGRWEDIDESHWTKELEDVVMPRLEDRWVGLENLGGTCYINSCLQLWFHNPTIRNLIFRWNPDEDKEEAEAAVADALDGSPPSGKSVSMAESTPKFRSLIANLQYVFASMMFGLNGVVNVQPLVEYLDIDPKTQQDFEEFSSLLRGCIENRTKSQSDARVRRMMQDEFQGETAKSITCTKCGQSFQSSEPFYELILTIQGKKDLYECLDSKFASERMEGNNQYQCRDCGLQDAVLTYSLKSMPSMLCIQLLRFGFDMVRQKLTDCVRFPEHLELGKYKDEKSSASTSNNNNNDGGGGNYDLVSVLIHMGCSSKSGHYIDCIKEYGEDASPSKPSWYTFNDAIVNGPFDKLNLAKAEQETKQKGKIPPGYHSSSNAYILWYKRRDSSPPSTAMVSSVGASTTTNTTLSISISTTPSISISTTPSISISTTPSISISTTPSISTSTSATSLGSSSCTLSSKSGASSCTLSSKSGASSVSSASSSSSASTIAFLETALDNKLVFPPTIKSAVKDAVLADNAAFVEAFKQSEEAKIHGANRGKERQQFLLAAHETLWLKPDEQENFEFVSKSWLKKGFFDADKEEHVETMNNRVLACPHDKLDPNKVLSHTKIVDKDTADLFYAKYRYEGPRFSGMDAMCLKCVTGICKQTQWKVEVEAVKKTIRTLCGSYKPDGTSGCWVGKRSFSQWSNLAGIAILGEDAEEMDVVEVDAPSRLPDLATASTSTLSASTVPVDPKIVAKLASMKALKEFNEDLRCQHGRLEPQKTVRRLVPRAVWDIFARYFPASEIFVEDAPTCTVCANADREEQEAAAEVKRIAQDLKKHLSDFVRGDKRPDLRIMHDSMLHNPTAASSPTLHVIPRHFVSQIQRFLKSPATDNRPVSMSSVLLLCQHGKMMYNLEAQTILDSSVDLVWQQEYEALEKNVEEDARVTARFVNDLYLDGDEAPREDGKPPRAPQQPRLLYDPPLCVECAQSKLAEKKRQMFEFEEEKIFIRKLGDRDTECKLEDDDDAFKVSVNGAGGSNGLGGGANAYENDPEFQPGLIVNGASFSTSSSSKASASSAKKRLSEQLNNIDDETRNHEAPETKKFRSLSTTNGPATTDDAATTAATTATATTATATTAISIIVSNGEGDSSNSNPNGDSADLSRVLALLGLPTSFGPRSMASMPRVRKRRNDKEVQVSSSDSLKDLKKKIFAEFQIAPFDQHLFFDETKVRLDGDDRTLGQLGVTPHCLILVRGDKPSGRSALSMTMDDVKEEEQAGQAGFTGTKLVNGGWN